MSAVVNGAGYSHLGAASKWLSVPAGGYNVSNATFGSTDQMVVNLMLEDQEAQFELPGMLLRVSTAKYLLCDEESLSCLILPVSFCLQSPW